MATRKTVHKKAKAAQHPKPLSTKKILANELRELLTPGLAKWKKLMGEEKFEKKIRKAAKVLAEGVTSVKAKPEPAVKKSPLKKKKAKVA